MIHFTCRNCQSRLKAPESRIGARLPCPSCSMDVVVPHDEATSVESRSVPEDSDNILDWLSEGETSPPTAQKSISTPPEAPQTKQCPFCAETIQFAAQKCRFCGEFLDGRQAAARTTYPSHSAPPQKLKDPGLAAVFSFLIPGLGQVYNGQIVVGILAGISCVLLYFTIVLGLMLHIWLIYDAYSYANRLNQGRA